MGGWAIRQSACTQMDRLREVAPYQFWFPVVDDAIRVRESSRKLAGGEDLAEFVRLEAHGDDGLRRRVAVAASQLEFMLRLAKTPSVLSFQ